MPRLSWTAKDVVAASDEWIWIPDGSREVRTEDYLVVVADEFLPSPTSVFVTDKIAARSLTSSRPIRS